MNNLQEKNRLQLRIKIVFLIYFLILATDSIIHFYYASEEGIMIVLSITTLFIAIFFGILLARQFKKLNTTIDSQRELIRKETKLLLEREWNLTQALKTLEKEKDKAIILEKLKSDFVTVMAHKLRTPLSKIKWSLNTLGSVDLPKADQESLIKQTAESNEHLINLVHELLDVTLLEEGAFAYSFTDYSLSDMITEIIKGLEFSIVSKKLNLTFSYDHNRSYVVRMDKPKLMVAVGNVIDNAIKYSHEEKTVEVDLKTKNGVFVLSVSDIGPEIPDPEQKNIFKKFFRGKNAIPMHTEGFGLGLYFCKEIVKAHKGTITFESLLGGKTTFTITLPIGE